MMKQKLLKIAANAGAWTPDLLLVVGAGSVSYGAGMVYEPAGWMVGGLFALAAGWLLSKGAK